MYKTSIAIAALALAGLGWQQGAERSVSGLLLLKEEALAIEYTPAANEAVVVIDAESEEALTRVEVRDPGGTAVLRLAAGAGQQFALSGFTVETLETSATSLFQTFEEGVYQIRARTADGRLAVGSAVLSHALLAEPVMTYPAQGATGVPTTNLTVSWNSDPAARSYRVILEQDENDGLSIELPGGSDSFRVPDDYLARDTLTQLEVAAISPNGNSTIVEVHFTTR